ncbi:branched-chain amino acid ABC transporter permease [Fertoeibacter niger]|uniref:branched-chain amino acid ABC transporter permease n=1 Tax=Fertoeibacter niger TaxID=2656921 RepID=UPI00128B59A6|nr:branched-chain amino acid ABC transporter permease [Fertoeibacter niger]
MSFQLLAGQLVLGLINGSFYALLSLGLAIIFGILNIANFAHGAQYMFGAMLAWGLLEYAGIGYWYALPLVFLGAGLLGLLTEAIFIRRMYHVDPLYGILLTFGITLMMQGVFRNYYGVSGLPYSVPASLSGSWNLGVMYLPIYRVWVIVAAVVICFLTWYTIEKTRIGANLRAATENPTLAEAFGLNVPLLKAAAYAGGVGLAGLAGAFAAPVYSVNPMMGSEIVIVAFAVVVIGGMGSIKGAIIAGFSMGALEGLAKVFWPEFSAMVIYIVMVAVILYRPGVDIFGRKV